jgi:hypothetical protein
VKHRFKFTLSSVEQKTKYSVSDSVLSDDNESSRQETSAVQLAISQSLNISKFLYWQNVDWSCLTLVRVSKGTDSLLLTGSRRTVFFTVFFRVRIVA